jgi:hypothetical protein
MRRLALALTLAVLPLAAFAPSRALADGPPPVPAGTPDPQLARLKATPVHALEWNWVPAGQSARYGHAEALVNAPVDVVRKHVLDYPRYKDYSNGKFRTARVVDKNQGSPGTTDMYVQVPIFHGMIMLWQVVRFEPLKTTAPGNELLQGKLVRGNVRAADIQLTIRVIDPQTTIIACDLLITPEMAAPQAAVDEELRDAAFHAVQAIQFHSHKTVADALTAAVANGGPAAAASSAPSQVASKPNE